MSSSINTALGNHKLWRRLAGALSIIVGLPLLAIAQGGELSPPQQVMAGHGLSIPATGSGDASFYLVGPGSTLKKTVHLGGAIELSADDTSVAGRYVAIICENTCRSAQFFVTPAPVATLALLVHPSRVSVKQSTAISGVVFPFDKFHNLVTAPASINFQLISNNATLASHAAPTQLGVAWFRATSGERAGTAKLTASLNDLSVTRVLQLVASDPCNLRINAKPAPRGILVETEPVRDCFGNTVPDGTIISFTARDPQGKSTVDTPVKQGIARANLAASGLTTISAASGVVMGNELRMDVRK